MSRIFGCRFGFGFGSLFAFQIFDQTRRFSFKPRMDIGGNLAFCFEPCKRDARLTKFA